MKKKILAWCDFNVPTGFANVAKNLLEDLHDDYELSILGINYHGHTKYDTSKWFVYSITNQDPLGIRRLPKIAAEEKPDQVIAVIGGNRLCRRNAQDWKEREG